MGKDEAKRFAKRYISIRNNLKLPISEALFLFDYPGDKDEAALIWYYIDQEK